MLWRGPGCGQLAAPWPQEMGSVPCSAPGVGLILQPVMWPCSETQMLTLLLSFMPGSRSVSSGRPWSWACLSSRAYARSHRGHAAVLAWGVSVKPPNHTQQNWFQALCLVFPSLLGLCASPELVSVDANVLFNLFFLSFPKCFYLLLLAFSQNVSLKRLCINVQVIKLPKILKREILSLSAIMCRSKY